jgi:hypothetical protein
VGLARREVKTIHPFLFDEDDTSPIGQGLPNVMRDSQMSIAAATRMLLDNASVVCGPNLELNMDCCCPVRTRRRSRPTRTGIAKAPTNQRSSPRCATSRSTPTSTSC